MTLRVLFENQHYVACLTRAGLSVQRKSNWRGKCLVPDAPSFGVWLAAFEESLCASESNDLCRGFLG